MLLSYLLICISGASILSLEIVGTRVLGPFYGVSLFLWSALISVTLASLSVGYAIGGRLADRGPRLAVLARIFAAAGVWVLLVPWLKAPLLDLTAGLGLRAAVLIAATVLFAPPLTLLGMVSPYLIRMSTAALDQVGRTAGDLFAVSTVASVAAALATGFWLIPSVGVTHLLQIVGVLLMIAAGICFLRGRQAALAVLLIAVTTAGALIPVPAPIAGGRVLLHTDSAYGEVAVLEREEGRYLLLDGGVHTILSIPEGESLHEYEPVMASAQLFFDEPGRALVLGLGGGILARDLLEKHWQVDAVEIDPVVVRAAHDYFDLPKSDALRVFTMDARRFLIESADRYDLVLVDVFGSSSIPFHLASAEMFALLHDRLTEEGMVVMNAEARQWHDPLIDHLASSMHQSFEGVWALPTQEPPNTLGNVLLLGSPDADLVWPEERLPRPIDHIADAVEHWQVVQMNHAWDNRFVPDLTRRAWTDDRSSVELHSEAVNRIARAQLREFFSETSE